jgi:hypothetical protein
MLPHFSTFLNVFVPYLSPAHVQNSYFRKNKPKCLHALGIGTGFSDPKTFNIMDKLLKYFDKPGTFFCSKTPTP